MWFSTLGCVNFQSKSTKKLRKKSEKKGNPLWFTLAKPKVSFLASNRKKHRQQLLASGCWPSQVVKFSALRSTVGAWP